MKRKLIIILWFVSIVLGCQSRQLEIPEVVEPSVEPNLNLINENYVYVNAIVNNQEQILAVERINSVEIINHSFLTKENIGEAIIPGCQAASGQIREVKHGRTAG